MDKLLIDNIELCDILHIKSGKVYIVHVKDGFDVKLRDCYIQVVLAAKRLSIDLNDSSGSNYLIPTLRMYNRENPDTAINIDEIVTNISNSNLEVVFVLAFRNRNLFNGSAIEKIRRSNSNIAKYSIINVVKEMNGIYDLKLIDISDIESDF